MTLAPPSPGLSTAQRLLPWLQAVRGRRQGPLMVGISGPQGAGKSTLAANLVQLWQSAGVRAVTLSIDDFYLTRAEQLRVAAEHPGNPYLEHRGHPGTHDVQLGTSTLTALRQLGEGEALHLPSYDKSAHAGRGDRRSAGIAVRGPFEVILLEGWMVGFTPPGTEAADPRLREIDRLLAPYEAWWALLEVLVLLRASDPEDIVRWRVEAEAARAQRGEVTLDRAATEDYIRRFLPAYERYVSGVAEGRWKPDRQQVCWLGPDRSVRR